MHGSNGWNAFVRLAPRRPNRGDDDSGGGVVRTRHYEASHVSSRQRVERVQVEDVPDFDVNLEAQTEG